MKELNTLFLLGYFFIGIAKAEIKELTLSEALKISLNSVDIEAERYEISKAEANKDLIDGKFNPQFSMMAGVGPINKAYGDAINSQNSEVTEIRNWRALYLVNIEGHYPLYSWGQKNDYYSAAQFGKIVGEYKVKAKINDIQYQVKESFYNHLLAANFLDFINEGLKDIETAQKKVKNKDDEYRLIVFENLMKAKKENAQYQYDLSLEALKFHIGVRDESAQYRLKEKWLEYEERAPENLEKYLSMLIEEKPELKQIQNGIKANEELAKAAGKDAYPRLAFFMKYQFSKTDARQPQNSVYAYDPYNENSLVAGVGFKWDIDFGVSEANAKKYNIEALQLRSKEAYALKGIRLLVEKNWREIKSLQNSLEASAKANKYAKKFLSRTLVGGALGLIKGKDVVDAYEARILTFTNYFQTIHDYNLAWARLSQAVGVEVDPLLVEKK